MHLRIGDELCHIVKLIRGGTRFTLIIGIVQQKNILMFVVYVVANVIVLLLKNKIFIIKVLMCP